MKYVVRKWLNMKLYKKYENDLRGKVYHDLAREYLVSNNINVKYW